jgi:hypothetical protein
MMPRGGGLAMRTPAPADAPAPRGAAVARDFGEPAVQSGMRGVPTRRGLLGRPVATIAPPSNRSALKPQTDGIGHWKDSTLDAFSGVKPARDEALSGGGYRSTPNAGSGIRLTAAEGAPEMAPDPALIRRTRLTAPTQEVNELNARLARAEFNLASAQAPKSVPADAKSAAKPATPAASTDAPKSAPAETKSAPAAAPAKPAELVPQPAPALVDLPPPAPMGESMPMDELLEGSVPADAPLSDMVQVGGWRRGYGMFGDQPGLWDNLSMKFGVVSYGIGDNNGFGDVDGTGYGLTLEYSEQLGDRPIFLYGGYSMASLGGENPMSFSLAVSKLAKIEGDRVVKPLIASFSYDGYYDDEFFGSGSVYVDQFRILLGWGLRPWMDAGVWGAIGTGNDRTQNRFLLGQTPVLSTRNAQLADRVAGYLSYDWTPGTKTIASVGWQEGQDNFFAQLDVYQRLRRNINLFASVGYTDNLDQAWDLFAGIEFLPLPAGHRSTRLVTATRGPSPWLADGGDGCDPCGTGGASYRGGFANGVTRSALRVQSPAAMRRSLVDPRPVLTTDPIPQNPPGPRPQDPPTPRPEPPVVNPPDPNCVPRFNFRPKNESRMSRYLSSLGSH